MATIKHKYDPTVAAKQAALLEKLKSETAAPTTVASLAKRVAELEVLLGVRKPA